MTMLLEKVPEEEHTTKYRDSCFTQVMGEDGHGSLCTWGLMRKKDLNLQPSHEAVESIGSQLREEMQSQFDVQIAQMKTQMEAQLKVQMEEHMARLQQEMRAHLERVGYTLTSTTHTSRSQAYPLTPSSTGQVTLETKLQLVMYLRAHFTGSTLNGQDESSSSISYGSANPTLTTHVLSPPPPHQIHQSFSRLICKAVNLNWSHQKRIQMMAMLTNE